MLPKIFGLACSNWCQVLKDASASSRGEAVLKFIKIVWPAISKLRIQGQGPLKHLCRQGLLFVGLSYLMGKHGIDRFQLFTCQ